MTHPVTADALFSLPDDGYRYDLVRGELRRVKSVWIIERKERRITVHRTGHTPEVFSDGSDITDELLPGLKLPLSRIFTLSK